MTRIVETTTSTNLPIRWFIQLYSNINAVNKANKICFERIWIKLQHNGLKNKRLTNTSVVCVVEYIYHIRAQFFNPQSA